MVLFNGDFHTVRAAHRSNNAVRDLNALDRARAAEAHDVDRKMASLNGQAATHHRRAEAARKAKAEIEARITAVDRRRVALVAKLPGLRAMIPREEAATAAARVSQDAVLRSGWQAAAGTREHDRRNDVDEAWFAGLNAAFSALMVAIGAVSPSHPVFARTGLVYPDRTREYELQRIRDDAYDEVARRHGIPSSVRAVDPATLPAMPVAPSAVPSPSVPASPSDAAPVPTPSTRGDVPDHPAGRIRTGRMRAVVAWLLPNARGA